MDKSEIERYIDQSVNIEYKTDNIRFSLNGIITAVTLKKVVFLLFGGAEDDENELMIPICDVNKIKKL